MEPPSGTLDRSDRRARLHAMWDGVAPAWGAHASFYWPNLLKSRRDEADGPRPRRNMLSDEHLGLWEFHSRVYGPDFDYPDGDNPLAAGIYCPTCDTRLQVRGEATTVCPICPPEAAA